MLCIILADCPHWSGKHTFLKPGLRVKKFESAALAFSFGQRHRPTPRPLAFDLLTPWRLITTITMADYMLVFVLQKILSLLGLLGQNIMLLCHYAEQKRIMDNRIRHLILDPARSAFSFYCLFVYSVQALCSCSVSSPFLVTYRPGIWTKVCWVVYYESIWMQIFLKRC